MIKISQYNPVSTRETSAKDALSVRSIHDLANGVNAFARNVPCILINELYPDPAGYTTNDDTEEANTYVMGKFYIPERFTKLYARFEHAQISGSVANMVWRLYAASSLDADSKGMVGTAPVTNGVAARSVSFTSTSTTWSASLCLVELQNIMPVSREIYVYFGFSSDSDGDYASAKFRSITVACGGIDE